MAPVTCAMSAVSRPARRSSSKWLGVTIRAAGTARSQKTICRTHEHPADAIADHGIAAIGRVGVGSLDLADGAEDRRPGFERADIAGQHAVAACEHAALGDAF